MHQAKGPCAVLHQRHFRAPFLLVQLKCLAIKNAMHARPLASRCSCKTELPRTLVYRPKMLIQTHRHCARVLLCNDFRPGWDVVSICKAIAGSQAMSEMSLASTHIVACGLPHNLPQAVTWSWSPEASSVSAMLLLRLSLRMAALHWMGCVTVSGTVLHS